MTQLDMIERVSEAIWRQYAGNPQSADWNAVDPHYKATVWAPMATEAIEATGVEKLREALGLALARLRYIGDEDLDMLITINQLTETIRKEG